jgi:hypothetical protein
MSGRIFMPVPHHAKWTEDVSSGETSRTNSDHIIVGQNGHASLKGIKLI